MSFTRYPGENYFREHNPRIRAAEEKWEREHRRVMIRAEVKKIFKEGTDKVESHALLIGDREIGRTKLECDAMMSMHLINESMDHNESEAEKAGFDEGYQAGIDSASEPDN